MLTRSTTILVLLVTAIIVTTGVAVGGWPLWPAVGVLAIAALLDLLR